MTVRILALSGGIGGAKLALGLAQVVPHADLTIAANPGDDFEHLGLTICPDLDTLTYTLSGLSDTERGWGRQGETWNFMAALGELGGDTWFNLGDRDLALHAERTRRLRAGETLSEVTAALCGRLGIGPSIVPATDQPVRTVVETPDGPLPFQHYFVRLRCEPRVTGFRFEGAAAARPSPALAEALADPGLAAVVICPSNPFISIDPILAIPGVVEALNDVKAPIVAVSPVVGGAAVKGPTAKMLAELGFEVSASAVARHYRSRIRLDGYLLDEADAALASDLEAEGLTVAVAQTVMTDLETKTAVARAVLSLADRLRR
ncbi:LPPG:FO 2-phospho-L-lactate transferase [Constrictibacter sp. MBR-5]|uniref:2-phospho-L-lactate transferase n=1 Tax=Constrictibacter sp. MBR-5 TaxID=3156467 RepID=UPI0033978C46